jgi:hypothetical protein
MGSTLFRSLPMSVLVQQPVSIPQASKLSTSIDKSARKMEKPDLVVSSPYTGLEHHLDLKSVPETSRQLALALQRLRPIVQDYPSKAYVDSFNWREIINFLPSSFSGNFPKPLLQTFSDNRRLLLHRLLLHSASQRRHLKTALPRLAGPC